MKNIYSKIKISIGLIFLILLSFISGLFKDVITLFLIILFHEIGHIISSIIFGWKIKNVKLTVCGGFITYDDKIDKKFKEEFLISISGFIFQGIIHFLSSILFRYNILSDKIFFMISKYNLSVFLFNILPIYPLDGSKILSILFNKLFSYKKALKLTFIASIFSIIAIMVYFFANKVRVEVSYLMIIFFIIWKLINLLKDIPYLFNRFLFERYIYPINTNKIIYVKNGDIDKIRRQKKHYFFKNNHYYSERDILKEIFD